ncbi:MAG TPA: FHIPEP family type III secretion protein, partial [Tepidisphaeraceae bacterium]
EAAVARVPWSRAEACIIPSGESSAAQEAGIRVLSAERVIFNHLLVILRRNAAEFVGIQEVSGMIERLKQDRPDLVKALIPTQLTLQQVTEVLKHLLRERIPVRDLRLIFDSLARYAASTKDPATLAEYLRRDLRRLVCARYSAGRGVLNYYALHPEIERMIQEAMVDTPAGPEVALSYDDQQRLIAGMEKAIDPRRHLSGEAVVLSAMPNVRRYLAHALEHVFPDVVFLAFQEIAPECVPNQIGIVTPGEGE